jgi:hypothetical protein
MKHVKGFWNVDKKYKKYTWNSSLEKDLTNFDPEGVLTHEEQAVLCYQGLGRSRGFYEVLSRDIRPGEEISLRFKDGNSYIEISMPVINRFAANNPPLHLRKNIPEF